MALSAMSFAGTPENPVPKDPTVIKISKAATTQTLKSHEFTWLETGGSKTTFFYKGNKSLPPQQVIVQEGVTVQCPSGGSCYCWGDVTTVWTYVYMHGWFIASQTVSNLHQFCL